MAVSGNVYMDCATAEDFAFVKIQTLSGYVHPQAVKVVAIQTERTGKTRAPALNTGSPLNVILHAAAPANGETACVAPSWLETQQVEQHQQ